MSSRGKLSWFDRLCWKFIEHVQRTDPDKALRLMGIGEPPGWMQRKRPSGPYGVRGPRKGEERK